MMIGIEDVRTAQVRINDWIRKTPVVQPIHIRSSQGIGTSVTLKLECLQVTGSFKARGAMNAMLSADRNKYARGLVTASGGNHGLATARTAHVAHVPATIFVPSGVSPDKVRKMKLWNAEVKAVGSLWDEANAAALRHAESTGAFYLHPFADPFIVAGQGTLGLDILDDIPELDAIIVAIGGGGLIAGLSTAIKAIRPSTRIIGVEPVGSPTLKASVDAGRCISLAKVTTRVPTMACRQTDPRIFDIVRELVDDIVLITDDEMQRASEWLWFEMGIAADLSGSASIAALRRGIAGLENARNICALVCGAGSDGVQ
jgi:threonine dehydratase